MGAVLALGTVRAARAEEASPPRSREVEFHADHLELDAQRDRLELDGHVTVTVDRYRLTSDRLSLERGPRGVRVEGGGRVAFCPCPEPPFTLGFRAATAAPPTDLFLEQPTLRVYGVPVLWLPYLWLRSPRRLGLLPLEVSYRGRDGAFVGSGVHVPLGDEAALAVGGGGYFQGGAQLDARLVTPRTATAVRWDHLGETALQADLRGAVASSRGATVAWSVDARRGGRALSGPAPLEDVALRQDRARLSLGTSDGAWTGGVEGQAVASRGGPLSSGYAWSPGTTVGLGGALGDLGAFDAAAAATTWRAPGIGAVTLLTERAEVRVDASAGPLRVAGELRSRGTATLTEDTEEDIGRAVLAGGGGSVELPLVKELGSPSAPLQHWLVPFAAGALGIADSRGVRVQAPPPVDGGFYAVSSGVRTTLGQIAGERSAVMLAASLTEVGQARNGALRAAAWRAAAQARLVGLRSEGAAALSAEVPVVMNSVLRLGPERALHVTARASGTTPGLPRAARWALGGWDAPMAPWFDVPGWSMGGGATVPWTRAVATAIEADYDLTRRSWLGVRGTVGYRHPCRCVALAAWGSRRLSREGVDVWVTLDLMP